MFRNLMVVLAILLGVCGAATAQFATNVKIVDASAPVTTTAAPCVPARGDITTLYLYNNGTSIVWYRQADGTNPSAGAAGTASIAPGTGLFWPAGNPPRNGINCVSDSGTDNLTVQIGVN